MAATTETTSTNDLEIAFGLWTDAMEMESKYVLALGEYKKNEALSILRQAVAAGQLGKARRAEIVARELEAAMRGVRRHRRNVASRIRIIETKASDVSLIRLGERLSPDLLGRMWSGFNYFQKLCPQEVLSKLANTPIVKDARDGSNFGRSGGSLLACESLPGEVESVLSLLAWLQARHYLPRCGSPAYAQVTNAFSQVATGADSHIKSLEASLAEVEQGTVNAWKPMMLAMLTDDDVSKAIVKASLDGK
jgi:hypothetical protein